MGSRIDDRHTGYAYWIDSETVFIIILYYEDWITMLTSVTRYNMRIPIHNIVRRQSFPDVGSKPPTRVIVYTIMCVYNAPIYILNTIILCAWVGTIKLYMYNSSIQVPTYPLRPKSLVRGCSSSVIIMREIRAECHVCRTVASYNGRTQTISDG